ncbi:MAG: hypothetical protein J0H61_03585 [Alphaproteobacteria bacterium]|nr:hypothetical protein [Alphaproteobacteria bacterium]
MVLSEVFLRFVEPQKYSISLIVAVPGGIARRQRRGNRFTFFLEPLQVRYFRKAGKAQL